MTFNADVELALFNLFDIVDNICYIYNIMNKLMIQKHRVPCQMLSYVWRKQAGEGVF